MRKIVIDGMNTYMEGVFSGPVRKSGFKQRTPRKRAQSSNPPIKPLVRPPRPPARARVPALAAMKTRPLVNDLQRGLQGYRPS